MEKLPRADYLTPAGRAFANAELAKQDDRLAKLTAQIAELSKQVDALAAQRGVRFAERVTH